jgi:hypothetical protein
MHNETIHFLEAVALDPPVMVTPEQARQVMEVYMAADLSAARNDVESLPLNSRDLGRRLRMREDAVAGTFWGVGLGGSDRQPRISWGVSPPTVK